jgi:preprotein translocase subunit SecG
VIYLLYTLHVLVCVFLILVVLLQQGKGADLSVFGGGSTQTAFGARGATTFLHKLTVTSFIIFVITTVVIGLPRFGGNSSVLRDTDAAGRKPAAVPARTPSPGPAGASKASPPRPPLPPAPPRTPPAPASKAPAPQPPPAPRPGTPR